MENNRNKTTEKVFFSKVNNYYRINLGRESISVTGIALSWLCAMLL